MRRLIPVLLILCGLAAGAIVFGRLPDLVTLRWGEFISGVGEVSAEPWPRALVAFGVPVLALALWLLLRGLASATGERVGRRIFPSWFLSERTGTAAVGRFGPTYDTIVLGTVSLLLLFHAAILAAALGAPSWTARVVTMVLGVGMMVVGNIMPRTRPNWVAGLRTRRTLADPDVWRRTHRWFGALLMLTGIAVVGVSFVAVRMALAVAVGGALTSAIVATIVGGRGSGASPSGPPTGPAGFQTR
ncbi:MAG TPA: SdpI family protein [Gemmatimonadaceae bacterium]|nr:SdpI family protein [Gemmatimonadaceae bacterium]